MADKRNWFQKFFDQTAFGAEYTLHLTPEQSQKAINELNSNAKKDWRTKSIIKKLQSALEYPTIVGQQKVIAINLDTSDTIRLKNILNLTRDSVQCRTTNDGFICTTTRYGSRR